MDNVQQNLARRHRLHEIAAAQRRSAPRMTIYVPPDPHAWAPPPGGFELAWPLPPCHGEAAAAYAAAALPALEALAAPNPGAARLARRLMLWQRAARWSRAPLDVRFAMWLCGVYAFEAAGLPPSAYVAPGGNVPVAVYTQGMVHSLLLALAESWHTSALGPGYVACVEAVYARVARLATSTTTAGGVFFHERSDHASDRWLQGAMFVLADIDRALAFFDGLRKGRAADAPRATAEHAAAFERWAVAAAGSERRFVVNETFFAHMMHGACMPGDVDGYRATMFAERGTRGGYTSSAPQMGADVVVRTRRAMLHEALSNHWESTLVVLTGPDFPGRAMAAEAARVELFSFFQEFASGERFGDSYVHYVFHETEPPDVVCDRVLLARAGGSYLVVDGPRYVEHASFAAAAAEWSLRRAAPPAWAAFCAEVFGSTAACTAAPPG